MTREVALSLGANLGAAHNTVREAIAAIAADPRLLTPRVSSLYRTSPVGGVEQADFINAVVVADTTLEPHELIALARRLEEQHGRTREVRWGPRTLDVDILALGSVVSHDPEIVLPHPRAHERAFVLVPWAEISADAVIVGHGTVAECLRSMAADDLAGVRLIEEWE